MCQRDGSSLTHSWCDELLMGPFKAKIALDKGKQERKAICNRGERENLSLSSTSCKGGWRGWILGHLCLLTDFTPRKSKLSPIFITGGNFPTCSEGPTKVSFFSPIWHWEIGALLPLMFSVQRWLPGTWRKVLDCKTGKRPVLENLHLKETEKGFTMTSVLK